MMPIQPGEPVYFLSLELENVGAFGPEGVRIDLSDGRGRPAKWTLILGENGIGKTTALECLLGLTPNPNGFDLNHETNTHAYGWMFYNRAHRFSRIGNAEPVRVSATVTSAEVLQGAVNQAQLSFEVRYDTDGLLQAEIELSSPLESTKQWPGKPIYSYRAARDSDFESASFPETKLKRRSISPDESIRVYAPISVDEWLTELHHASLVQQRTSEPTEYDEVRSLLVSVLPSVQNIRHRLPEKRGDTVRMEYLTDDGWVSYDNLGLGYKSVMGLIGDLAYRLYTAYPDAEKPLEGAAVVLIDEIDLHLHAKWQRDLIRVLSERFPNVQFIATAHSPLMVQAAAGHNLVLLYRDPETRQVRVANDVDEIANWRLDQIVTSELFGLPSAVRPQLDPEIRRRDEILAKAELTDADRAEVRKIESELGDVPLGTTEEAQRMNDLLRQVLGALESKPTE